MNDETLTLIAEALVALAEGQDRATRAMAEAQDRATREMTAAIVRFEEAVRALPAPVVNMPAPVANAGPQVQDVRIVGMPKLNARVRRDRSGRIESIEE